MYKFNKNAYTLYKECLQCGQCGLCATKQCKLSIKTENMDKGRYLSTGLLVTGENFFIDHYDNNENSAWISLSCDDDLTHLNSWLLAFLEHTKYPIEITLRNVNVTKIMKNIIPVYDSFVMGDNVIFYKDRVTLEIKNATDKISIPEKYKGYKWILHNNE